MLRKDLCLSFCLCLIPACGGRAVAGDEEGNETSEGTSGTTVGEDGPATDSTDATDSADQGETGAVACEPGPGEGVCEAHGDVTFNWILSGDGLDWEVDGLACVVVDLNQVDEPTFSDLVVTMDCGLTLEARFGGVEPALPFAPGMPVVVSSLYTMDTEVGDLWLRITDDVGKLLFGGVDSAQLDAPSGFVWTGDSLSVAAGTDVCPGEWFQGDCFVTERVSLQLSAGEMTAQSFDGNRAELEDASYRLIVDEASRINCWNEASDDPTGCGYNYLPTRYVAAVISGG